ncbi:hypothetical protein D3C73_1497900 [compost metagenome]
MQTTGVIIPAADEFLVGKEDQIVAQHTHLLLEGIQHLNKKRVCKLHIQLAGKNHPDQVGLFGG